MTARDDLAALNHEFGAPDATMHVSEFGRRRAEILARMYHEPKAPEAAPAAAPAPTPPQAAIRLAPLMDGAMKAELETFKKEFREARERDDAEVMVAIINDARFLKLIISDSADRAQADIDEHRFGASAVLALFRAERELVRRLFQTHVARRKKLEARIAALEARPHALAYGGTWAPGQESEAGYFYTCAGSIWYCREATLERPGQGEHWQLACKRGADGKDLR